MSKPKYIDFNGSRIKNLEGEMFDMLETIVPVGIKNRYAVWKCLCDCGNICEKSERDLYGGRAVSCGCDSEDISRRRKNNTWEQTYIMLRDFIRVNGEKNLRSESKYLYSWMILQRHRRKKHLLTPDQEILFDMLDVNNPAKARETAWNNNFKLAVEYKNKHGNVKIPTLYITEDGEKLGQWWDVQKTAFVGKGGLNMYPERRKRLIELGIEESINNRKYTPRCADNDWQSKFELAVEYKTQNGNVKIPDAYVTEYGIRLGRWWSKQKAAYKGKGGYITDDRKQKLFELGIEDSFKKNSPES